MRRVSDAWLELYRSHGKKPRGTTHMGRGILPVLTGVVHG